MRATLRPKIDPRGQYEGPRWNFEAPRRQLEAKNPVWEESSKIEVRIRKGLAAFTEPVGEYEGDPQSTIIIQVLI